MALQICLRLDEKFEKFEHNFTFLGMEMAELYKEYAKLKAEFSGQIALLENEVAKLREQNGILTSRLMMNNAAEIYEQNFANIQSMVQNNDIAAVKCEREEENIVEFGTSPGPSVEQQYEIASQQIVEQKQHYTANPLDELNEISADGFGQIEENAFDEEGDEIVAGTSMEMNGTRERMVDAYVYGHKLSSQEGQSIRGNVKNEVGQQQQKRQHCTKKKICSKKLICQWPGCGLNIKFKSDMQRHWRTHTGEKPYSCTICGRSFARDHHMRNHELTQHNLI